MMSTSSSLPKQITRLSLAVLSLLPIFSALPARAALTEAQQDAAITSLQNAVTALQSKITSQQSTITTQQTTINTLTTKLQFVTASGHDLTLTGNLHVVNGTGHTNATPNSLGNVIIGYNEINTASGANNKRTGSHNLIVGAQNSYTSYGGIVAGQGNTIAATYACVTGGSGNVAVGPYSSISGGFTNTATSSYASISGGRGNTAQSAWSYVGGGFGNTSSANYAAVGGGNGFAAKTTFAFLPTSISQESLQSLQTQVNTVQSAANQVTSLFKVSTDPKRADHKQNTEVTMTGVNLHIVNGLGTTSGNPNDPDDETTYVVNGLGNLIIGYNETRASNGDGDDSRTGSHNLIIGVENSYSGYGGIVCGLFNETKNAFTSVTGGAGNVASGLISSISGGQSGMANGTLSSISGGINGIANGFGSSVSGGQNNTAQGASSSVSGGLSTTASDGIWAAGNLHSD